MLKISSGDWSLAATPVNDINCKYSCMLQYCVGAGHCTLYEFLKAPQGLASHMAITIFVLCGIL